MTFQGLEILQKNPELSRRRANPESNWAINNLLISQQVECNNPTMGICFTGAMKVWCILYTSEFKLIFPSGWPAYYIQEYIILKILRYFYLKNCKNIVGILMPVTKTTKPLSAAAVSCLSDQQHDGSKCHVL